MKTNKDKFTGKCPKCGEDITIDSSRDEMFCAYCGAKFRVADVLASIIQRLSEGESDVATQDEKTAMSTASSSSQSSSSSSSSKSSSHDDDLLRSYENGDDYMTWLRHSAFF